MPRKSSGARLWLKPEERDKSGKLRKRAVWIIRDGTHSEVTGCAEADRGAAEEKLGEYITRKYQPGRGRHGDIYQILVTDVLAIWQADVVKNHARPEKTDERILQLAEFWVGKTLGQVTGDECDAYVEWRCKMPWKSARPKDGEAPRMVTPQGARRELEDLRSAINHHRKRGYHREMVEVVLPPKGASREEWLTRSDAARLLWTCWRTREVQDGKPTAKYPLRHLVRYILPGVYTGTRPGAICAAALRPVTGSGWIDADNGVWYRRRRGRAETKKRQTPVRLPPRLLAHIRRWIRLGIAKEWLVEHRGEPVAEVNKGLARAAELCGLDQKKGLPHVVSRHTCATWLMQNGADIWDAAGFLGMTTKQLEDTYGHHHPDHQKSAVDAAGGKKQAARAVPGTNVVRLTG